MTCFYFRAPEVRTKMPSVVDGLVSILTREAVKFIECHRITTKLIRLFYGDMSSMKYSYLILADIFIFPLISICAMASLSSHASAYKDGESLAQAVYDRRSPKDSSAKVDMLLNRDGKVNKRRVLFSYGLDKGDSERLTLMRFVQPKDVDGTGLLSKDYLGDNSDQWLYLPSLDRVRRISSKRKGGRFVGSDFFYEDLRDREVSMDHHQLKGEGKAGKVGCLLLESTPVKKTNSIYTKRLSCIHPKILLPLWTEFYKKNDKPIKRLKAKRLKKYQGYWTIFESVMENLKKGTSTQLITRSIRYNQSIPESLFTQRGLEDAGQEIPYRPTEPQRAPSTK